MPPPSRSFPAYVSWLVFQNFYLFIFCGTLWLAGFSFQWHPTPVLLPRKSHGRRSLVGCSPWSCEESDTTVQLLFHFSLSCIGEGNGNPLQCSCLENPRDGEAWWAAIYGVAQSWTRLKWLSSSSSRELILDANNTQLTVDNVYMHCQLGVVSNPVKQPWHATSRPAHYRSLLWLALLGQLPSHKLMQWWQALWV